MATMSLLNIRTGSYQLLALVVRPEAADGVAHLAEPGAGDAVEEAPRARRAHRLAQRGDHALVARRLHPHLGQVERARSRSGLL